MSIESEIGKNPEGREGLPMETVTICGGFSNPSPDQATNGEALQRLGRLLKEAGAEVSIGGFFGSLEEIGNGMTEAEGSGTIDVARLPNRPNVESKPGLRVAEIPNYEKRLGFLFEKAKALIFVNPSRRGGTMVEAEHAIQRMIAMRRSSEEEPLPPLVFVGPEWEEEYRYDVSYRKYLEDCATDAFEGNPTLAGQKYMFFVRTPEEALEILRNWKNPQETDE